MASFKAEVQNKRKDGTYNLRIRVIHNKKVRRISTNLYLTQEDLSIKGLKIKNQRIIDLANDQLKRCRTACNEMGSEITYVDVDELVIRLKNALAGGSSFRLDIVEFGHRRMAEMSAGTAMVYNAALNALTRYTKRDSVSIEEITVLFLKGFERFIEQEPSRRGKNKEGTKKGGRAVSLYLTCIKALHRAAKEEYNDVDRGIINIPYSPFEHTKIKPQPRTRKRALTIETIQQIIDLPYKDWSKSKYAAYNLAKDCFLISFVLLGINSVDMYYALPAKKGVLTYNRKKTATRREDRAEMRVRIESCISVLLDKYADAEGERLFDFYNHYASFKTLNKVINLGLKEVGKSVDVEGLTFYAARHSWATIARSSRVNIDKATVHEALNHVDTEMRTTDIYIDKDWSVIWNANSKVLDLFDWSSIGYDVL